VSETTELIAKKSRISTLNMIAKAKAAHLGSSLSVIDILSVLFGEVAKVSKTEPDAISSDQVLISKGHAAAGSYAVISHSGFFDAQLLDEYCQNGSLLSGHVTYGKVPGIPFSTGSLGHGLPLGIGLALARKQAKADSFVYVVMSDGECDEGTTWESALIASQFKLDNLIVLVDRNRLQSFGDTEKTISLEPFKSKWESFGWDVHNCDGHSHEVLAKNLSTAKLNSNQCPKIIICDTVKGKGVSFMENQVVWHYRPPNDEQLAQALAEIKASK
jgi:transketolase